MTEKRILVISEGKHELGDWLETPLPADGLPALPCIVNRLLGLPRNTRFVCRKVTDVRHVSGKGEKWARKVKGALLQAKNEKYDGVVFLIDRDRKSDKGLPVLASGRDELANNSAYPPCAVGVAVETFDAWMIADGNAIKAAGGDGGKSNPHSERMDGKEGTGGHPKDRAAEIFGGGGNLGPKYAVVAANVDLDVLSRCCPHGFAPFSTDVKSHLS